MSMVRIWTMITVGVIVTLIGDIYLKRSNGLERPAYLALGLLFYTLGCGPVIVVFKRTQFGLVFILWEAITVIAAIGIGRTMFHEAITPNRLLAVALAIGALFLSTR